MSKNRDNGAGPKVKLLEKQKSFWNDNCLLPKKNHFDMMIDIAEEEYKIDIRNSPNNQTILNTKTANNVRAFVQDRRTGLLSKN
jgi:hypothetical protein